jgi:hypothetical protein
MSKKEPGAGPKAQAVASKPAVHSPLPWSGEHGDTLIMDADDITVIELHSRLRKDADMDFILKAVNSHAALVRALAHAEVLLSDQIDKAGFRTDMVEQYGKVLDMIRAARKLAGEEI